MQVECPKCKRLRWYPLGTLRQILKRKYTGYCKPCDRSRWNQIEFARRLNKTGGRRKIASGYVELRIAAISDADVELFKAMRRGEGVGMVFEHRWVMAKILGRPLVKGEEVHHKNGQRDDNRPENLELWTISQPPGGRVEDKVAWAREILALYGDQF